MTLPFYDYAMRLRTVTRAVYGLRGVLYLLVGVGSIALPAGWISSQWAGDDMAPLYTAAAPESYLNHLTQEFGTLAVGFIGSLQRGLVNSIAPLLLVMLGLLW